MNDALAGDYLDDQFGVADRYPLAQVRLWASAHTSQRRAFTEQGSPVTALFGGNRSGKTFALVLWVCCNLLGSDHPAVYAFLVANGIPFRLPDGRWTIPPGPGNCRLVALDSNASIEYHRPLVARLLAGADVQWWKQEGQGEARLQVRCPGYSQPGRLIFKSNDQGRLKQQGAACRAIGIDEEGDEDVWDENLFRIMDPDPISGEPGRIMLGLTPLRGFRWVYRRYEQLPREEGAVVHRLWTEENPHMDAAVVSRMLARFDDETRAARSRGEWVQLRGRVYRSFSRSLHVVRAAPIPAEWPRYRGVDFGFRHPFACVWLALSPDGQAVVYRQHYRSGWTTDQHAARIAELEVCAVCQRGPQQATCAECGGSGRERITDSWADPSRPDSIVDFARRSGVRLRPARRDVQLGIDAIIERLRAEVEGGAPALVVHDSCPDVVHEFESYAHADSHGQSDGSEKPLKTNDHAMDALRYVVMGLIRPGATAIDWSPGGLRQDSPWR